MGAGDGVVLADVVGATGVVDVGAGDADVDAVVGVALGAGGVTEVLDVRAYAPNDSNRLVTGAAVAFWV